MSIIPTLIDLYNRAKASFTLLTVFNTINIATAVHLLLRQDPKNDGVVVLEAYKERAIPKLKTVFPRATDNQLDWVAQTVWDFVKFVKGQNQDPVDQVG
jgi:hypothetical protein